MIDTGGTLAKARFNDGKGALSEQFVHTPSYLRCLRKNRKFSIIRTNSYDSIPLKRQSDKIRVELCSLCRCYAHGAP
jgi:hypothetical protein